MKWRRCNKSMAHYEGLHRGEAGHIVCDSSYKLCRSNLGGSLHLLRPDSMRPIVICKSLEKTSSWQLYQTPKINIVNKRFACWHSCPLLHLLFNRKKAIDNTSPKVILIIFPKIKHHLNTISPTLFRYVLIIHSWQIMKIITLLPM